MLTALVVRLVTFCRVHALAVVLSTIFMAGLLGAYTLDRLGVDSNAFDLIDPNLPWRQREIEFGKIFPRDKDQLVVVVDGAEPGAVDEAATQLAARLAGDARHFKTVTRPGGGAFFRRNGLLFLSIDELSDLANRIATAQPLIGSLAADPSLRGLFDAFNLALTAVESGDADLRDLERPFESVADVVASVLAGQKSRLAWSTLITGRSPQPDDLRRLIVVQPVLDYTQFAPGAEASTAIRETARALHLTPDNGFRVRLTGPVALSDEEFASATGGMAAAMALSTGLVMLLLYMALRYMRLIAAAFAVLVVGFVATAAFATAAVGVLNMISVAFGVMFVGLAVDFSIQFCVRFRDERSRAADVASALAKTAAGLAGPLSLAAAATAIGFWSFVPTAYVGVSELGLIAGTGMVIAVLLNFSLLPALLALLRPPGGGMSAGFPGAAKIEAFLLRRRRTVGLIALALGLLSLAALPALRFDANPLNLRDPKTESVSTLLDLMSGPNPVTQTANIVTASPEAADRIAHKLDALPVVSQVVSINSFIPDHQDEKLAIIQDMALLLGPALAPPQAAPPSGADADLSAMAETVERLRISGVETASAAAAHLARALRAALTAGPDLLPALRDALLPGLERQLETLRLAVEAQKVTMSDLPSDLIETWVASDGRARVEVFPKGDPRDSEAIRSFVEAVQHVAPDATGGAIANYEGGQVVVHAFMTAAVLALTAITVLLGLVLRRASDVLLTLAPLLLAGLLTLATCAVMGLSINFANIIALPLLLGVGVAYPIYYVVNWRAGVSRPLQSPTTRAVVFSAFTTGAAFGSLALSSHPGTASMGVLLSLALGYTLISTLLVLPALLGPVKP